MFRRFVKACRKYRFSYSINTVYELTLVLHPSGDFYNIEIKQGAYNWNYRKLFSDAIKRMKDYRKERGC